MSAATNPLTYNGYVSQIAEMAIVPTFTPTSNTTINGITYLSGVTYGGTLSTPDTNFNAIISQMLNYAELRIQRDLDLNQSMVPNTNYNFSSGNNVLSISIDDYVTLETVSIVSGTSTIPLNPTTKEFIQNTYNDSSYLSIPQYFAIYGGDASTSGNTYQNIIIGPYPNQNYPALLVGTIRMPSLYQFANTSQANTSTNFISTYLPDLLIMASLIYISAYQRNFGRMSDDPSMAQSYEGQYQALLRPALTEEYRKKFEASAWSSSSQSPVATPTRGQ
jgi:hypothetical protein